MRPTTFWNRCYSGIYRANLFLQKQDGIDWKTDGLKERMKPRLSLRAYFYWDGTPLRLCTSDYNRFAKR